VIPILYEDNHLLVVVKPVGIPVQADASGREDLLTLLKADLKERYRKPGNVYLGLVHRLDQPVGGVMVFAKTSKAAARLSDQIRRDAMEKTYLAVVCGAPKGGRVEDYLKKDPSTFSTTVVPKGTPGAKWACLEYVPLETVQDLTLVRVNLITGRSHQIRVQMQHQGCPLWGDARYNPASRPGQDIALFACKLTLEHPTTHEKMTFEAKPTGKVWSRFHTL